MNSEWDATGLATQSRSREVRKPNNISRKRAFSIECEGRAKDRGRMRGRYRFVVYEDEHLLVVNKPAGWNTHAPHPHANEGVYEWLRNHEPKWATLAIIHRLDKETSGLLLFTRTPEANRSLTEQFTRREVQKQYELLTDRKAVLGRAGRFVVKSKVARAGERYMTRPDGEEAETEFEVVGEDKGGRGWVRVVAWPKTGRTHQIRVHASEQGFPILGDGLYGGAEGARVYLHARRLKFKHPSTGEEMIFEAEPEPDWVSSEEVGSGLERERQGIRMAVTGWVEGATTGYRMLHGASDGWPGWYVDRLGDWLLVQSEQEMDAVRLGRVRAIGGATVRGIYFKRLSRHVRGSGTAEASPQKVWGEEAPGRFEMIENGLKFSMSFVEGYSVGLFLDQRENRRRWLRGLVAGGDADAWFPRKAGVADSGGRLSGYEVLNTFSYTCGFSVVAAAAGARVTSLDLAKKYLEWGKQNLELNGLDPAGHDFVFGDTLDWMKRWQKKGRTFDAVILDPPTFSQSKEHGRFQAEKDYDRLVEGAARLLPVGGGRGGVIMASTNAARLEVDDFLAMVRAGVERAGRRVKAEHYVAQPPDFPISREEPGYFKSVWVLVR